MFHSSLASVGSGMAGGKSAECRGGVGRSGNQRVAANRRRRLHTDVSLQDDESVTCGKAGQLAVIAVSAALCLFHGGSAFAYEPFVAIRGATIETGGKQGRIATGIVVLKGDKIHAVGQDVKIPDNARIIDARGKTVMPGIIDPYHVVSGAASGGSATRTIVINGRTYTIRSTSSTSAPKFQRIVDGFDPYEANFRPLVRAGVTSANLVAAGYGQSALARMSITEPGELIAAADGLAFVSLTNDSTSLGVLRAGLAAGKASSSGASTASSSRRSSSRLSPAEQTLWKEIVAGKRRLLVNASNSATILHVLKLVKDEEKVRLALVSNGPNIYETLEQLRGQPVSLILAPSIDFKPNSRDRICVPRLLHDAGIEFAISVSVSQSSLSGSQDSPLVPLAFLVKAGLPRDVAFASLTSVPAKLLGTQANLGTIEPRKTANLLVFDGDPLELGSRLETVMVEGETVYED